MGLDRMGPDGSFGVFVRSDTNVEDLPGFTGAGLNLTVFNVVGYEDVLAAVKAVWASPFTERAYGWRQSHMEQPEYVFPAVVVQKSFPSEKSGVLVTVDVDTGARGWLSVAVSEGVGGAVEGQATESLLIDANTGEVRFLAQATAPLRMALSPTGGIVKVPASGSETVLQPAEIQKIVAFARTVGGRFPSLQDEDGTHLPADVEFAFRGGELTLLQIRPFVESRGAQQSSYLSQLDAAFRQRGAERVDLKAVPREPNR
jgi:phosphoenolpyruvate synthase/pyruvate phosphate dikinase